MRGDALISGLDRLTSLRLDITEDSMRIDLPVTQRPLAPQVSGKPDALVERLALLQAALPAGRWDEAATGAAALYERAKAAKRMGLAAEAGLVAAKALFNLERLDQAEAWCARARNDAQGGGGAALLPALWVVTAAVRGRLEQVSGAIDAVNRALSLQNEAIPAGGRRTVYFGVAITYRALGLWRHAVEAWRAAIDADRHHDHTGGGGLTMSQANFVETSLRAHDDLVGIAPEVAARLLQDAATIAGELAGRLATLQSPWLRFLAGHAIGGVAWRSGRYDDSRRRLEAALAEPGEFPVSAVGAAQLDLARALDGSGNRPGALEAAGRARQLLVRDAHGPCALHPLPNLHDLWRAEQLCGDDARALQLLAELHARLMRNTLALMDAQVAGLVRAVTGQTLRLHNTDLREANEDLLRRVEDIRLLAGTDPLTGILNRRALDARWTELRSGAPELAIVMVDIDHFKSVNDSHSHGIGDLALQRVAAVLGAGLRGLDCVGRWGGEEFAMLMPHTGLTAACAATERLRCEVESHDWQALSPGLAVTISAGVVVSRPGESFEQALARADALLYRAKHEGRNRVIGQPDADATD
jgi:diguanylate cyclase (GGDEF)-like protein